MIEPFKFYVESGLVRKGSPDPAEANAMVARAEKRLAYVGSQSLDESNASFLFEDIYEVMRECVQGLMASEGYKPYSHEATVAYLREFHKPAFGGGLISAFDRYRILRNNVVYRLSSVSMGEAEKALVVARKFVEISKGLLP